MRFTTRRTAAASLLLVAPLLAACSDHSTSEQLPSGNGASASVGAIELRGITIVKSGAGIPIGTVIGTLVNTGTEGDTLTSVAVTSPSGSTTRPSPISWSSSVGRSCRASGGRLPVSPSPWP